MTESFPDTRSELQSFNPHFAEITPLPKAEREQYPSVIFESVGGSPMDSLIISATFTAAQEAGLHIALDRSKDKQTGLQKIIVRASASDRRQETVESALFQGTTGALTERIASTPVLATTTVDELYAMSIQQARRDLGQIVNDPDVHEAFKKYYGGLRWGTDQEKFTETLIAASTPYDAADLDANLTGSDVSGLTYHLDLDVPYEKRREWGGKTPAEIFADMPELDYHRLADPVFLETAEGQELYKAYKELCGEKRAREFSAYPRPIRDDGTELPKPLIPLTKFPVIEALFVAEVSQDRLRAKYDMGPQEVADLITSSDSVRARHALVRSVNTRLPKEARHVFDGPSEFDHKRHVIGSILGAYREARDETHRESLKQDVLSVLEAYTASGEIAQSVRAEYEAAAARGITGHGDIEDVKRIAMDILTVAIASPDINDFLPASRLSASTDLAQRREGETEKADILALSTEELELVILSALSSVSGDSDPRAIRRVSLQVFGSEAIADAIQHIAELRIAANEIRLSPAALLAIRGLRKYSHSFGDANPAKEQAERNREEVMTPANELSEQANDELNTLILERLQSLADSGRLAAGDTAAQMHFRGLVTHLSSSGVQHMRQLPPNYTKLVALAQQDAVPDSQKSAIFWQFAETVRYSSESARMLLPATILDIYQTAFGPVDSIRMPTAQTAHLLGAANFIARENRVFAHATEAQLLVLSRYRGEVDRMVERVNTGAFLSGSEQTDVTDDELRSWREETLYSLERVTRELDQIESTYQKYLHIEDVRRKPEVYYPWLTEKLKPFWHGMQREVVPGNMPRADIRALHSVIKDYVSKLRYDHPEGFDYIGEGNLGEFLLECYNRMIVPHDIKYNGTVWKDGLTFMHHAVAYMPPTMIEQLKHRYHNNRDFLKYIEAEHARWNKGRADDTTTVVE